MNKNIIVISHRRSGTHLTIDSIRNNIKEFKSSNFLNLNEDTLKEEQLESFITKANTEVNVIKTHFLSDFSLYTNNESQIKKLIDLFSNSHLIYVYRNGLDVMVSLYEYMKKYDEIVAKMEFDDFIKTNNHFDNTKETYSRSEFWKYHISYWKNSQLNEKLLNLKYEDFISDYSNTLKTICNNFELKINDKIIDIRLSQSNSKNTIISKVVKKLKGISKTTVSGRKGVIGDYKNYFSEESLNEFRAKHNDFLKELGYDIDKL